MQIPLGPIINIPEYSDSGESLRGAVAVLWFHFTHCDVTDWSLNELLRAQTDAAAVIERAAGFRFGEP